MNSLILKNGSARKGGGAAFVECVLDGRVPFITIAQFNAENTSPPLDHNSRAQGFFRGSRLSQLL